LAEAEKLIKESGPVLAQLKELDAQAEQLKGASQAHDAEGAQMQQMQQPS